MVAYCLGTAIYHRYQFSNRPGSGRFYKKNSTRQENGTPCRSQTRNKNRFTPWRRVGENCPCEQSYNRLFSVVPNYVSGCRFGEWIYIFLIPFRMLLQLGFTARKSDFLSHRHPIQNGMNSKRV